MTEAGGPDCFQLLAFALLVTKSATGDWLFPRLSLKSRQCGICRMNRVDDLFKSEPGPMSFNAGIEARRTLPQSTPGNSRHCGRRSALESEVFWVPAREHTSHFRAALMSDRSLRIDCGTAPIPARHQIQEKSQCLCCGRGTNCPSLRIF